MKYLAAERHSDTRENSEEFLKQAYDPCGGQSFGKGRVSPHIGK
jgi:hypothetical protein